MKPTVTILVCVLAAGLASAQRPSIIQNTRNTMNTVSDKATAASNEALGIHQAAPAAASATHAPAKSSGVGVATPVMSSSRQAGARSADAKRRYRARRGGAVVLVPSAEPKPTAVRTENAKGDAPAEAGNMAGSGAGEDAAAEQSVVPDSKHSANGRRDPFISPVVSHAGGSGCSTGKKCLEIGAINLRGVVRAESGFIAVVSNGLNKAYFLRENDPVFNGYVMKITGDSIVFQETVQDRLGKTFTREVVKKITTPAV
ncbi:MAG: hypothetical protein ABR861_11930 [Terriglobales bacterium]|jgi:hypothetical protein